MIPPDVASSLRQILPDQQATANAQTKPVIAAQKIADVLSNFTPGQRVFAEIQSMLPNGTYRAIVAQRDVTLALPFSAKAGDSLELEVTENNGKLALAVVSKGTGGEAAAAKGNESVATTLSQTGKLIGDLQRDIADLGKRAAPAALNGNQPLVNKFPDQAAMLAPVLKEALTKSGVFYEAHQARWAAGDMPTEHLRQEPQGKLSPAPIPIKLLVVSDAPPHEGGQIATQEQKPALLQTTTVHTPVEAKTNDAPRVADTATPHLPAQQRSDQSTQNNPIPRELVPIVQQQLDALATQNYAWQGQIWPGQKMQWEIGEGPDRQRSGDEADTRWQTRLSLNLPSLGGVDAILRLTANGDVKIAMTANSELSQTLLRNQAATLTDQMAAAGLNLTQFLIQHGEIPG